MSAPLVIGLTGNIACGKSTVLASLQQLGAETIDADVVYHSLTRPGTPLWRRIKDRFGSDVLTTSGEIDRGALGRIVFRDPTALRELDLLTHREVVDAILDQLARSAAAILVIDAVKLFESGLANVCNEVWLVVCDREQQVARLQARNHLTEREAQERVAAQPPPTNKLARADVVIDNSGTIDATVQQVRREWRRFNSAYRVQTRSDIEDGEIANVAMIERNA